MIALATGIASIGSGCQTTPQGYNFGAGMVNQAVGSYISGQLDPKGTNVTVNNRVVNSPVEANNKLDSITYKRLDNGQPEKIFGYYRGVEDLGKDGMYVNFMKNETEGVLISVNQVVEIVDN